jgi:hypothetical protein
MGETANNEVRMGEQRIRKNREALENRIRIGYGGAVSKKIRVGETGIKEV